jgi:hypothetical protein
MQISPLSNFTDREWALCKKQLAAALKTGKAIRVDAAHQLLRECRKHISVRDPLREEITAELQLAGVL